MIMMMMMMMTMVIINALINKMIVFYFAIKAFTSADNCFCELLLSKHFLIFQVSLSA